MTHNKNTIAIKTLLALIKSIPVSNSDNELPARFPIDSVIHTQTDRFHNCRAYAGRVSGGTFKVGDTLLVLPTNRIAIIKAIDDGPRQIEVAVSSQTVTLWLDGDANINRGDMLVKLNVKYPQFSSLVSLMVCWLDPKPLQPGGQYIIRHTTDETKAIVKEIRKKVNINSLENNTDDNIVQMNDIAYIVIKAQKPLKYDAYYENRMTGSLELIDENTLETLGVGMIVLEPEVFAYSI